MWQSKRPLAYSGASYVCVFFGSAVGSLVWSHLDGASRAVEVRLGRVPWHRVARRQRTAWAQD